MVDMLYPGEKMRQVAWGLRREDPASIPPLQGLLSLIDSYV